MHKRTTRYLFLALAIGWAGIIFYLSSQPGIDAPLLFPGQDKLFHLIVFAMLGFFLMGSMKANSGGYRIIQVWFVILLVAAYGVLDEFHQYFVPGRTVDIFDALADAAGGLLGAWAMYYLVKMLASRSSVSPPAQ